MRKLQERMRLRFEHQLGNRAIARSLRISPSTVSDLFGRFQAVGLSWPLPPDLGEASLEARLYPGQPAAGLPRPQPDWEYVHRERQRKGVTLQLLWLEYKEAHPDGYQYSQFCAGYRRWTQKLDVVLRQSYRAGEKMFVDFAGQTVSVADAQTGEVRQAQLFIAVLAASNYTYAEATADQTLPSWIGAHCRTFEFFGGVPEVVVPDNTKTAIRRACRYEPDLNPTYQDLALYYGTVVIPARPRKPRDRAKVEAGVQLVERWILAALRNHTFFSLDQVNAAVRAALKRLNERPFQKLAGSRQSLFETLERPALKPLPPRRYEFAEWKKAKVNIDYHVTVDKSHYSVPFHLVRERVDVRLTGTTVELLHRGQRVASHRRCYDQGRYITDPAHRPPSHRNHLEWTPSRLVRWAQTFGSGTGQFVERLLEERPHPEQGYRSCLGLMRLGRHFSPERLESACCRALSSGAVSYRSVKSILETGLDRVPLEQTVPQPVHAHEHVRGAAYYQSREVR
ncbi:MAG TPA: IS21 family transposase [Bacillota bacterium]|nr:IS21 family transposase [Bacillota bacterium]